MKSKQINFFISNDELSKLNKYLEDNGWVIVLAENSTGKIETTNVIERTETNNLVKMYLVPKNLLEQIEYRYIKEQNKFVVNPFKNAPVVEVLRPYYDDDKNFIRRGRLFYELTYVNEQKEPTLKPDEFLKSADKLFKAFRRTFKNVKSDKFKGFIITANTHKLIAEEGLELKQV